MKTDVVVFWVVMLLSTGGLSYSYGYQHGRDMAPCPEQNGYKVAYSIKQGADLKCIYVSHFKGLALKQF